MDSIKALIEERKKTKTNVYGKKSVKKYLTKRERQQIEQETLQKKQKISEHESEIVSNNDGTHASSSEPRKITGDVESTSKESDKDFLLPFTEVCDRLRSLNQPITLFGESISDRIQRMRKFAGEFATSAEFGLEGGAATRNAFLKRSKIHEQKELLQQGGTSTAGGDPSKSSHNDIDHDIDINDEKSVLNHSPSKFKSKSQLNSNITTSPLLENKTDYHASSTSLGIEEKPVEEESDGLYCYKYFKGLLRLWAEDLSLRPDHVKQSIQGRRASNTYKQCKDYIKPFLKLCKKNVVPVEIMNRVKKIVDYSKQGEYMRANDEYLQLSIGNKAWPIGVTSVGIHMRTGREKIQINKTTHVMNNNTQKKYITNIKRLITYAQTKFPTDPSKMVGNTP